VNDDARYVLYGSHASYATAKSRSYLRKKGIPFVERLPSSQRFREYVRPTSENHRIPQLEAPDGTVVQDTTAIFDYLEARFPEPPGYPPGPRQQLVARLFEVLLDAELGRVAWHYRWNYMQENYGFVGREFGRSFRPQGTDAELDHYGGVIAERMEGKRAGFGDSEAIRPVLEVIYREVLAILEAHFTKLPYLFGGLPSIADHVLMGPLFGHLARDPEPSRLMKLHAPRVFRWTEHMNAPEIRAPEFAEFEEAYLPNDEVPETVVSLLALCLSDVGAGLVRAAEIYDAWAARNTDRPPGSIVSPDGFDEAVVGRFEMEVRGVPLPMAAGTYPLWVLQRGLDWFRAQPAPDQKAARELLERCGGGALLDIEPRRRLTRVGSRMALE
jgi:glutathione S-transferase